jgi:hypothetical protein
MEVRSMSWQATAWVLNDGPRREDLDREGKAYGSRARGLRLVLLVIADAANKDGKHAHPGVAAIVEGSLYGRSQALALVADLIAEGWLVVEEEGKGRGHATVYGLIMDRRGKVQPSDTPAEGKGPIREPEGSDLDPENVRSDAIAPHTQPFSNELPNAGGEKKPTIAERDPLMAEALDVARRHWDWCHANGKPTPTLRLDGAANPFIAVAKLCRSQMEVGWTAEQVEQALLDTAAFTTNAITVALRRAHRNGPPGGMTPAQQALAEHRADRSRRNAG